jgi:hypothetical protein
MVRLAVQGELAVQGALLEEARQVCVEALLRPLSPDCPGATG